MAGGNIGNHMQVKLRGDIVSYKVKNAVDIFRGSMVMVDATGYALPASDAANGVFVGIAEERANNASGAAGAIEVKVRRHGLVKLKKQSASAITDVGLLFYVHTAQSSTVDQLIALVGTTTNDVRVGRCVGMVEDTPGSGTFADDWLLIDMDAG